MGKNDEIALVYFRIIVETGVDFGSAPKVKLVWFNSIELKQTLRLCGSRCLFVTWSSVAGTLLALEQNAFLFCSLLFFARGS